MLTLFLLLALSCSFSFGMDNPIRTALSSANNKQITLQDFTPAHKDYLNDLIIETHNAAYSVNSYTGLSTIYKNISDASYLLKQNENFTCATILLNKVLAAPLLPVIASLLAVSANFDAPSKEDIKKINQVLFRKSTTQVLKDYIQSFTIPNMGLDKWGGLSIDYSKVLIDQNRVLDCPQATRWIKGYLIMHAYLMVPI